MGTRADSGSSDPHISLMPTLANPQTRRQILRSEEGEPVCGAHAKWKELGPLPSNLVTSGHHCLVCCWQVSKAPGGSLGGPSVDPGEASSTGLPAGQDATYSQNTTCPQGHSPGLVGRARGQLPSPGARGEG